MNKRKIPVNNNVRKAAFTIIHQVLYHKGYSNLLLRKYLAKFDVADKKLLTTIVYGVLKNNRLLQYQFNKIKDNKTKKIKLSPKQKVILFMAMYQYYFLDRIPVYAITAETNKLSQHFLDNYQKKFIVMLLHQLLTDDLIVAEGPDELTNLSINYSHPLWLLNMMKKQYGQNIMLAIIADDLKPSLTYLRLNRLRADEFINGTSYLKISANSYQYLGTDIARETNYQNGIISVQDLAAQQVALLLNPQPNSKILDLCAAPGTKTCHLAELMNDTGLIKAYDLHAQRVDLITKEVQRLHLSNIEAKCYDSTKLLAIETEASFDYILCDAPCTGLGVIKRKPEIKLQDINTTMDEIIKIQAQLLTVAYRLLKQGGSLVYSTCTLNKKENEFQIKQLVEKYPDLIIEKEKTIFGYQEQSDSFYMCKLYKK